MERPLSKVTLTKVGELVVWSPSPGHGRMAYRLVPYSTFTESLSAPNEQTIHHRSHRTYVGSVRNKNIGNLGELIVRFWCELSASVSSAREP